MSQAGQDQGYGHGVLVSISVVCCGLPLLNICLISFVLMSYIWGSMQVAALVCTSRSLCRRSRSQWPLWSADVSGKHDLLQMHIHPRLGIVFYCLLRLGRSLRLVEFMTRAAEWSDLKFGYTFLTEMTMPLVSSIASVGGKRILYQRCNKILKARYWVLDI